MSFTVIDIFFAAIILVCALVGTAKGFISEIFGKAAWIIGVLGGLAFYPRVSPFLTEYLKKKIICDIGGFILVFIVLYLIIKIVQVIVNAVFSGQIFRGLDRSLGFFLGIIEGAFICAVFIMIVNFQNVFDASNLFNGSFFYKIYLAFVGHRPVAIGGAAA